MSELSSTPHGPVILSGDDPVVLVDDPVLPAAVHLTGDRVADILRVPVEASGGTLDGARSVQVRYRPGSELVVRYDASVRWAGSATPVAETLMASTTRDGVPIGTVPVVADHDTGRLEVGVWRWPFDPVLRSLEEAVTPTRIAATLGLASVPAVEVVAYRPTERAVVRLTEGDGRISYLKVLPPGTAARLAARHQALFDGGVPVPRVVDHDDAHGILHLEALLGDTLRERLKLDARPWPGATAYTRLLDVFGSVPLGTEPTVPGRVRDAFGHAAMLSEIVPEEQDRLDRITDRLRDGPLQRSNARVGPSVHGDLYEAQLVVEGDRIIGLLDIDDAGPGDPLVDRATVLAHLGYRAAVTPRLRDALTGYASALRRDWAPAVEEHGGLAELDVVTAATAVGLATGPFRVQQRDWRREVRSQIRAVEALLDTSTER